MVDILTTSCISGLKSRMHSPNTSRSSIALDPKQIRDREKPLSSVLVLPPHRHITPQARELLNQNTSKPLYMVNAVRELVCQTA